MTSRNLTLQFPYSNGVKYEALVIGHLYFDGRVFVNRFTEQEKPPAQLDINIFT